MFKLFLYILTSLLVIGHLTLVICHLKEGGRSPLSVQLQCASAATARGVATKGSSSLAYVYALAHAPLDDCCRTRLSASARAQFAEVFCAPRAVSAWPTDQQ